MTRRQYHNKLYNHIRDQVVHVHGRWLARDAYKDFRRKGFNIRTSILLTDTMMHDWVNNGQAYGKYTPIQH